MAIQQDEYYYNAQIRSYVLQFMAIFQGMQVHVGKWTNSEASLIPVPIHYGHPDRVVAAIISENVQNKPIRLPVMSAYITALNLSPERRHGTGVERRNVYTPIGGLVPDDTRVVHQRTPTPYDLGIDLLVYTSNTDQHFQILEQILPLFDPQLTIQTTDGLFDMTRMTSVFLDNISMDTNNPIGTERRIIQSRLSFSLPIWIDTPADVRKDFIEKIYLRIGAVDTSASTSEEIISELDDGGFTYDLVQSTADLPIS